MKLITGATGRIGNVLVKEINKLGERVKVLVREESDLKALKGCNCEYVYGDILKIPTLENSLSDIDSIFHLAGHINISAYNKNLTYDTNIQGTKNIIDLCIKFDIPMVYTSSIHAIASPKDGSVITEDTPFCIDADERRGIYDCSKAYATKAVLEGINNGLKAIVVHPTGVTGPYDFKPSYFGLSIIDSIRSGLKVSIQGAYDYVDVRDVVWGMLKAFELKKFGERYILSGEKLSIKDMILYLREFEGLTDLPEVKLMSFNRSLLYASIVSFFNRKSRITPYSVKTLNSNCNISHNKATKELGYEPMGVKQSLYDQYTWLKENNYF
ncbi:MAG: NAD-dependent epimerase/dehydratase family protein [Candidatus Dojkabacteria bacterium]|nr:NAD-dependent epimerase/dehydratase family protein [Candidatus Dojkabacteria bacterium]